MSSTSVQVTIPVVDALHHQPVTAGIVARTCGRLDLNCSQPTSDDQKPDATGAFTFALPAGVPSIVEIRPEDSQQPVVVPGLVFITPPEAAAATVKGVQLISPDGLSLLTFLTSTNPPVDGTGVVVVLAQDCFGASADGVSFDLTNKGASSHAFFFQAGAPSQTASATDASGIGGFDNVPPGMHTLTAVRHADGTPIGIVNLTVRANTISYSLAPPTDLSSLAAKP
jgi:hypothetical protein